MSRMLKWGGIAVGGLIVLGLIGSAIEDPAPSNTGTRTSSNAAASRPPAAVAEAPSTSGYPAMFGKKYALSVAQRIDELHGNRDCTGLQREFDIADRNDDATRSRTGSGTADLMSYIDGKLRSAGCYR